MSDSEQQLFLIEFLVDRVNIPSVRAIHDQMLPVTTCVSFQILSLPPVNIEQAADSEGCTCEGANSLIFNKGKSCLFALPTIVLEKPLNSFPIIMSVYKKLPPGVLPDVMLIGTHQIQAKDLINTVLNRRIFKSTTPSKTSKETYKITTATGQAVGQVNVFMRISCFGRKIVTQFQIPHNKKPFLFKGELDSPVIQCKKIPSEMECQESKVPKCICKPAETRENFGAGEAQRTCCPVPPPSPVSLRSTVRQTPETPMNQRPCCPSSKNRASSGNVGNSPMVSSNPYTSQLRRTSPYGSPDGPTSGVTGMNYGLASGPERNEPAVRKCGCTVKMEKRCGCSWKS